MLEDIYDLEEWGERLAEKEERDDAYSCDQVDAIIQGDWE